MEVWKNSFFYVSVTGVKFEVDTCTDLAFLVSCLKSSLILVLQDLLTVLKIFNS